MTTMHSEKFYMDRWDEYINSGKSENDYMNLENNLAVALKPWKDAMELAKVPEENRKNVIDNITRSEAKKISDKYKAELLKTMAMIKRVKAGEASIGYTDLSQHAREMYRIVTRFEFNCLQLSVFKKKYGV